MQTLANSADRQSMLARLARLRPDSPRQWGRMSPHQAVCHLSDSFHGVMGLRPISPAESLLARTLLRFVALHTPVRWPPGVPTRPEVDQEIGGTAPGEFADDVRALAATVDRFAAQPRDFTLHPHPAFGALTEREWMIWGCRHLDHHLRQFGA
ncbi:MAG TPA: DUF1569 domain-containing protein [Vicinamibacterales bacterium]|nr:DUF1569 domain-containing protein [Vicinamibacterales bacterium]